MDLIIQGTDRMARIVNNIRRFARQGLTPETTGFDDTLSRRVGINGRAAQTFWNRRTNP